VLRLQGAASRVHDKALKALLPAGVGFHHAALSGGDRSLVEQLFIAGDLLVCTPSVCSVCWCSAHLCLQSAGLHASLSP